MRCPDCNRLVRERDEACLGCGKKLGSGGKVSSVPKAPLPTRAGRERVTEKVPAKKK